MTTLRDPTAKRRNTSHTGLGDRFVSAIVAVVFFVPLLALLWWLGNYTLAWDTAWFMPIGILWLAIAAAALLGFAAPRAMPVVFGWLAQALHAFARIWWH